MRRVPVIGELGGDDRARPREAGIGLDRARERHVELAALARQQVAVDRLAQECVAELVGAVVAGLDEHVVTDGLAQAVEQVRLGQVGDGHEQAVLRAPACRGGNADDFLSRRGECLGPQEERVAQRLG